MYKIYADDTLIYDSTITDFKIGKGSVTQEVNKAGSFTFSVYPEHFYYDKFARLKTVITVYKSNRIIFRGRILTDQCDYWNTKVITCEGELAFLQDVIAVPYSKSNGSPESLLTRYINDYNTRADSDKRFKIGAVTVPATSINYTNKDYTSTLDNLTDCLLNMVGGYFYITHGDDGTDPIPTLNYLATFTNVASQRVEFGANLKNYTKTINADNIVTAVIPLGKETKKWYSGPVYELNSRLALSYDPADNFVYSEEGVAKYGWHFAVVIYDDVAPAISQGTNIGRVELRRRATEYLKESINSNITIELTALDLHLFDKSFESFKLGDYIRVTSEPHNFDATLLCSKLTMDLLKPQNDTLTLGYTYATFSETTAKTSTSVSKVSSSTSNTTNAIENEVASLVDRLDIAEENVAALQADLQAEKDKVSALTATVTALSETITKQEATITAQATTITDLDARLKYLEDHAVIEEDYEF